MRSCPCTHSPNKPQTDINKRGRCPAATRGYITAWRFTVALLAGLRHHSPSPMDNKMQGQPAGRTHREPLHKCCSGQRPSLSLSMPPLSSSSMEVQPEEMSRRQASVATRRRAFRTTPPHKCYSGQRPSLSLSMPPLSSSSMEVQPEEMSRRQASVATRRRAFRTTPPHKCYSGQRPSLSLSMSPSSSIEERPAEMSRRQVGVATRRCASRTTPVSTRSTNQTAITSPVSSAQRTLVTTSSLSSFGL